MVERIPTRCQPAMLMELSISQHLLMGIANIQIVKDVFPLPNTTTSVLQPHDQGIIRSFNHYYHRKLRKTTSMTGKCTFHCFIYMTAVKQQLISMDIQITFLNLF
jgi:hypothetical protein